MIFRWGRVRAHIFLCGLLLLTGLWGCRSTPSPIIVGDTYTNIQYEYSLTIPRGWEPIDEIPDEMGYFEARVNAEMASLLLYNEDSGGLITIMNIIRDIAFEEYLEVSLDEWKRIVSKRNAYIVKDSPGKVIKHALYPQNLYATQQNYFASQYAYKPLKYLRVESSFEVASQRVHINFDDFIFPCHNTRACETIVILTCLDKDLAPNQRDFETLLTSLQAHDYYD